MLQVTSGLAEPTGVKVRPVHATLREPIPALFRRTEDHQLLIMQRAFRASGGILGGDQLADLLRRRADQPISVLARWIVARQVVSFDWQGRSMLPLFQFDLTSMTLRPLVGDLVCELANAYDDWDLALWFASPHSGLGGATPVDMFAMDAPAVLKAARADRFIARA